MPEMRLHQLPAFAYGTTLPTAINLDWTATPSSLVSESLAMMENVEMGRGGRVFFECAMKNDTQKNTCRFINHSLLLQLEIRLISNTLTSIHILAIFDLLCPI